MTLSDMSAAERARCWRRYQDGERAGVEPAPGVRVARVRLAANALLQRLRELGEGERVAVSDLVRESTRGNVDASRLEDALRAMAGPLADP